MTAEVIKNLSEHFSLAELTKTNVKIKNVPNEAQVENLKRLCGWLEMLRERAGGPIIINSGYRSPEVNKAVGGVATSNHLTVCTQASKCYILILKATAAYELSHDARGRYFFVADRDKIAQELQ